MSEIKDLEVQVTEIEDRLDFLEKLNKLTNNNDFKEVIIKEFCNNQLLNNIKQSIDPRKSKEVRQLAIIKAQSVGHLLNFLDDSKAELETEESRLLEIKEALDIARSGDNE